MRHGGRRGGVILFLLDRRSCSTIVRLAAWRGGCMLGASPLHRLCSWQGHVKTQRRCAVQSAVQRDAREIARAKGLELAQWCVPGAARPLTSAWQRGGEAILTRCCACCAAHRHIDSRAYLLYMHVDNNHQFMQGSLPRSSDGLRRGTPFPVPARPSW